MTTTATRTTIALGGALAAIALGLTAGGQAGHAGGAPDAPGFTDPLRIDNPYLPLSAFRRCEARGVVAGVRERSVRTRLDRTEAFTIAGRGVRAVVIEDRAFENGRLVERTLDYYAQADDGTVHYLGEDVDDIEGGRVVGHSGTWRVGRGGAALGVAMPPAPKVGDRWRFEDAPGVTDEADEVVTRFPFVRTATGTTYRDVIRVREDLSPEGLSEHKLYARGVGEIRSVPWDNRGLVELVGCR